MTVLIEGRNAIEGTLETLYAAIPNWDLWGWVSTSVLLPEFDPTLKPGTALARKARGSPRELSIWVRGEMAEVKRQARKRERREGRQVIREATRVVDGP